MKGTAHKHPRTLSTDTVKIHKWAEVTGTYQQHKTVATDTAQKSTVHHHQWAEVTGTDWQHRTKVTCTPHIRTAKRNRLNTSSDGNKDYRYIKYISISSKEQGLKVQQIFSCDQRLLEQH